MSEENKAMVRHMVEGINAGEIEGTVDELFAPRAARRVKRLFGEFYSAFPDWREEIVELVAEGGTVAGRFRCSGTHLGEFLGEAPTGKRMGVEEVFFLRVENRKFVYFWALEDSLSRLRQLGLVPSRSGVPRGQASEGSLASWRVSLPRCEYPGEWLRATPRSGLTLLPRGPKRCLASDSSLG
ncbi:MAG: ester cyclase [Actinomycetota bacterium]|nr:ester cyclase [Actinomycetota bacterium]